MSLDIYLYLYFIFLRKANSPAGTFTLRSAELGFFVFFFKGCNNFIYYVFIDCVFPPPAPS